MGIAADECNIGLESGWCDRKNVSMTTTSNDGQGVAARYAVYWMPEAGSALASIGERWLGRESRTDRPVGRLAVTGFDDGELAAMTAEPRRYGLHATLKPPFRLARGFTQPMLEAHVAAFAEAQTPILAA